VGFLELLDDGIYGEVPAAARVALSKAIRSSNHLLSLVRHLLVSEKLESGNLVVEFQQTSVAEIIGDLLSLFSAPDRLRIKYEDIEFTADRNLLVQALSNLVSNALKYSPEDERVELVSEPCDDSNPFQVIDKRAGIPEEQQERVFAQFW
jgi:signal transduction histidine kinase